MNHQPWLFKYNGMVLLLIIDFGLEITIVSIWFKWFDEDIYLYHRGWIAVTNVITVGRWSVGNEPRKNEAAVARLPVIFIASFVTVVR